MAEYKAIVRQYLRVIQHCLPARGGVVWPLNAVDMARVVGTENLDPWPPYRGDVQEASTHELDFKNRIEALRSTLIERSRPT